MVAAILQEYYARATLRPLCAKCDAWHDAVIAGSVAVWCYVLSVNFFLL